MLLLSRSEVERALSPADCLEAVARAMRATSAGQVCQPLRQAMAVPETDGKLVLMPGWLGGPEPLFDVKIVSKFPRSPGSPHGTHVGAVMLFDAADGLPVALLEGGSLTGIRTAAASALATQVLARLDARVLMVFGAGEQARRHVRAICGVRPIERVIIWARDQRKAEALAQSLGTPAETVAQAALGVRQADIICTTTSASDPVLLGAWLEEGTHVNLVGSAVASNAEADDDCVARSRYYVDARQAALAEAGELSRALRSGRVRSEHIVGEIGQVLLGTVEGRRGPKEITLYKSLGIAAQDIAAASTAVAAAKRLGLGLEVALDA